MPDLGLNDENMTLAEFKLVKILSNPVTKRQNKNYPD